MEIILFFFPKFLPSRQLPFPFFNFRDDVRQQTKRMNRRHDWNSYQITQCHDEKERLRVMFHLQ